MHLLIDNFGNVGISNTTPAARLDVTGNVSVSGVIDVGHTALACSATISGSIRYETTSDTIQVCTSSGWKSMTSATVPATMHDGTGSANHIAYWTDADTLAYDSNQLYWDATKHWLGIGTAAPGAPLSVAGDISSSAEIYTGAGTAAVPAHSFMGDTNTGIYAPYADAIGFAAGGTDYARITAGGISVTNSVSATNGYFAGNVGIGASPITTAQILNSVDETDKSFQGIYGSGTYRTTVDGTNYYSNYYSSITPIISSGVSNTGYVIGFNNSALRLNVSDIGNLTSLYGMNLAYGHYTGTATARQTTNAYGIVISPYAHNGTITNMYDLYLGLTATGGTVTNRYALYQVDTTVSSYFGGNVGMGTVSATDAQLTILGNSYNAIELRSTNTSGTNTGAVITGARKDHSLEPFTALGTWDDGTNKYVYIGGNNWGTTTEANMLRFYTASTYGAPVNSAVERMTITAAGNVGIANTSPAAKLDVTGDVSVSGVIDVGHTALACSSTISGSIRYETTSDTIQVCTSAGWKSMTSATIPSTIHDGTGSANHVAYWTDADTLAYDSSQLYWDATKNWLAIGSATPGAALAVTGNISTTGQVTAAAISATTNQTSVTTLYASGNVGIGTGAPSRPLEIQASVPYMQFQDTDSGDLWSIGNGNGAFTFYNDTDATSYMTISGAGNVGVGTDTPGYTLEVSSTTGLKVGTLAGAASRPFTVLNTNQLYASNTPLYINWTNTSSGTIINGQGGNVAIGNATPKAELDVTGDVSVSGVIDVGHTALACSSTISGSIRFEATSDTIQVCTSAGWKSMTSATVPATMHDGTGSANHIAYWTDADTLAYDSSQLYWDASANELGIGTNAPAAALDVSGSAYIRTIGTTAAFLELGYGATANHYSYIDLVGDTTYTDYGFRIIRDNIGANAGTTIVNRGTGPLAIQTTEAGPITFATTNTERMRIDSSGNVGIGTTTPAGVLDLGSATAGRMLSWGGTSNNYGNIFSSYSGGGLVLGAGIQASTASDAYTSSYGSSIARAAIRLNPLGAAAGAIQFFTDAASTVARGTAVVPTERMRINSSGNVGIGTTAPMATLEVYGAGQTTAALTDAGAKTGTLALNSSGSSANSGGAIVFGNSQSIAAGSMGMAAIKSLLTNGAGTTVGDLAFSTRNATTATALTERMRILSTGNVGIGTAAPSQKLTVAGTIETTSGGVKFPDATTQTSAVNMTTGTYTGNGATSQTITLGFRPKMVIVKIAGGSYQAQTIAIDGIPDGSTQLRCYHGGCYGGDNPVKIIATGFTAGGTTNDSEFNYTGSTCYYFAIR